MEEILRTLPMIQVIDDCHRVPVVVHIIDGFGTDDVDAATNRERQTNTMQIHCEDASSIPRMSKPGYCK